MADKSNDDQKDFWTNEAGPNWVRHQARVDWQLQPVLDGVFDRADLQPGERVLDVGCGTGISSLQAAAQVSPGGHVTGLDISHTMLAAARASVEAAGAAVEFVLADAAEHEFAEGETDQLISRFGVMFFADSTRAFANMRGALRSGGKVTFASWGQVQANPYFALPASITREVLGEMPKADPDAPGPFAFRNPERVLGILSDAGFRAPACDVATIELTPAGDVRDFADVMLQIGQLDRAIRHFGASEAEIARLHTRTCKIFAQFETDQGLRIPAEINYFSATAP